MQNRLLFLGTGASSGVPVIGCSCAVCSSPSPFNKRLRPSALIDWEGKRFLIDAGPDFRLQALKYQINRLDGIILTHSHFDHIGGLDELRAFNFLQKSSLPCLLSIETFDELKVRYHYLMQPPEDGRSICAELNFHILDRDFGQMKFLGVDWRYVSYTQGSVKVNGLRLPTVAYISDIRSYTRQVIDDIAGVDTLILSALRYTPSEMHLTIDEAVAFAREVGAKKTWLTHIAHDLDHDETNKKLPKDIRLSYDGLEIRL